MHAEPLEQHRWLHKFVGEWTSKFEMTTAPDQPPSLTSGKETVRSLGGLWIVGESEGEMPGGGIGHAILTIGFDPAKNRFVGSFIGSMMPQLWIYDGQLDDSGKRLVLDTVGPNFEQTGSARYQDVFEIVDDNHRVMTSQIETTSGEWRRFVTAHYYRKS